jgi:hypothetical protein
MTDLPDAVNRQLDANRAANLLFAQAENLLVVDPGFQAAVEEMLAAGRDPLTQAQRTSLARLAADALLERLWAVNQFVHVTEEAREELAGIYARTWLRLAATGEVEASLREHHYPALRDWLARLYPEEIREALADKVRVGRVVCAEYPAEAQAGLLRLDPSRLLAPVLDVGCGRTASLVGWLRRSGIDAWGIDRTVDAETDSLRQSDWLSFDFMPGAWGTVIAHLSFTNHLVYVQRYEPARIGEYRQCYMRILESLMPGGAFVYAPGAPLLEKGLSPSLFKVSSWQAAPGCTVAQVRRRVL